MQNCFIYLFFNFNLKSVLLIFSFIYFPKWRYKEQTFPIFSTLTLCRLYLFSSMNIQVLLHFHVFSTLTISQLYLFSSTKIPSIFFILLCIKLLITYFHYIYEQTCFISHFFHFNLELALPILIDENTKKTHKIASFPVFCLIGHKITSYLLD